MSDGFSKDTFAFLGDLAANNNKAWFEANRARYEANVLEPAKDFVVAIAPLLDKLAPNLRAEPKLNGSIRKLHRDVRFSADKTPFKARLHMIFWDGAKATASPGFHVVLHPGRLGFGVGQWGFDAGQLENMRSACDNPTHAKTLNNALNEAASHGFERTEPDLKRVPKPYAQDHPNGDLMRYKSVVVRGDIAFDDAICGPGAPAFVVEKFKPLAPTFQWIKTHVNTA